MLDGWINSHQWRENIPAPMTAKEIAAWQAKINDIAGVTLDGTPHWRLAWGQDPREAEYDRLAKVWMPRHHWDTLSDEEIITPAGIFAGYEPKYIGVPRFFIVAYVPPENISDEDRAPEQDKEGNRFDAYPNLATWIEMVTIERHGPKTPQGYACCLQVNGRGLNCYGEYRPFDAQDLRYLEYCMHEWRTAGTAAHDPNQDARSTDNHLSKLEFYRRRFSAKKAREQREKERRQQHLLEMWRRIQAAPVSVSLSV